MVEHSRYRWISLALSIAIFYWLLESLVDALFFFEAGFLTEIFNPGFHEVWMRSVIVLLIVGFGLYAQHSINRLRDSEKKIEELYSLLLSIRNINQLIAQESDLEELFQKSADTLLEARDYIDTSIAVLKDSEIVPLAHSGSHERGEWAVTPEGEGEAPKCVKEVLETKSSKIIHTVEEYCKECEFCTHGTDHKTVFIPLLHQNSPVGFLSVCLEEEREVTDEEMDLLEEIADDLAFAREKIKTEQRLRESEERFRKIFEGLNDAVFVHKAEEDDFGKIVELNSATEKLFGYSREELMEMNVLDLVAEDEKSFEDQLDEGEESHYVQKKVKKDGEEFWTEVTEVPFIYKGKEAHLCIQRDITERRKTEEQRDFLYTLLRQDLRSKYQTIQGYHQLLEEADLPDKHKKYLRKTIETGREADEILELAEKLEEMEKAEWISEKNIVKVMNHVTDDISDLAEREKVAIEENYPESIDKVEGDYSLNNLFSQILKTRIRTSDCDKITISAEKENEKILIKVEDNGKKLPENIKKLFTGEPYTGETTGAGGVRYYMLREIAEHNNAKIEVQDSDLGGAKFTVYLKKAD